MVEQIFVPTSNDITVHIPDEFLGKRIRVRVETTVEEPSITEEELQARINKMRRSMEKAGLIFDTSKYKFNRDEANDYD